MSNGIRVGDTVRILDNRSIYYLWTATVTAVSHTGRVQVEAEPGIFDLFDPADLTTAR